MKKKKETIITETSVLLELKTQMNFNSIVGDLNTLLSLMDRSYGQKINRETLGLIALYIKWA